MIIGKLKPKEFFLENGWEQRDGYIVDDNNDFGIDDDRFGCELELKEFDEPYCGLNLQDINDNTAYKKQWFESLEIEDDDGEDLDEYGYPYQSSPRRGTK